MDAQTACWRCGEPGDGHAVCDLCGAVPARARPRVRAGTPTDTPARTAAIPAGGSTPTSMVGALGPPAPLSSGWMTGNPAPSPPLRALPRRQARPRSNLRIVLSAALPMLGVCVRLALHEPVASSAPPQRARSASDFSGRCVTLEAGGRIETVSCDDPHTGRVRAIVDSAGTCPTETIDSMVVTADPTKRLCITPS